MIATLAISLALMGAQQASAPQDNPGSQLVSKMLAYYASANSMTGSIVLTASDGAGSAQMRTDLQFEKPSKLYIKQVKPQGKARVWMITSDGTAFSYDAPDNLPGSNRRLAEAVSQVVPGQSEKGADGKEHPVMHDLSLQEIYAVGADSLGDRSVPLDIAIGRREDLAHDVQTWMTVEMQGKVSVNGVEANRIVGKWRDYGNLTQNVNYAPGEYELDITDDAHLVRYVITRKIARDPEHPSFNDFVVVTETWDVNLTPNGKVDPSLFKVVK